MDKKIRSIIALCHKSGNVSSGEETCEKVLAKGQAKLVIIAADASANTKKKFINKSFYYKVKAVEFATKEELSAAIGKDNRATIIITDEKFALIILNLIEKQNDTL